MHIRKYIAKAIQACFITNALFAGEADIKALKALPKPPFYRLAIYHNGVNPHIASSDIQNIIFEYLNYSPKLLTLILPYSLADSRKQHFSMIPCYVRVNDTPQMAIFRRNHLGKLQYLRMTQNLGLHGDCLPKELSYLQSKDPTLTLQYRNQICSVLENWHGHLNFSVDTVTTSDNAFFRYALVPLLRLNAVLVDKGSVPDIAGVLTCYSPFAIDSGLTLEALYESLQESANRAYAQFRRMPTIMPEDEIEKRAYQKEIAMWRQLDHATVLKKLGEAAQDPSKRLLILGKAPSLEEIETQLFSSELAD